jgi:hypothetical protein
MPWSKFSFTLVLLATSVTTNVACYRVAVVLQLLVLNECFFSVVVVRVALVLLDPVAPALDPIQPNDGLLRLLTTNLQELGSVNQVSQQACEL